MKRHSTPELILATVLSGFILYYAVDLSGKYGWLLWLAPAPLLWIARRSTGWQMFTCAFVACAIGRLNWVPFLLRLMPVAPVVVITITIALLYALVFVGARRILVVQPTFLAILAFPLMLTASEYAALSLSYDGTAGSLAYTQMNYLSVIQIASLTGIWGILFLTALIPSTLVVAWHLREDRRQTRLALTMGSLAICAALGWGWFRASAEPAATSLKVGLTVIPEKAHGFPENPKFVNEKMVAEAYVRQILPLARQGAKLVLFPERAIQIADSEKDSLLDVLRKAATESQAIVAGGITVHKGAVLQNLIEFVSPDGTVQEYQKKFHVKGFEDAFERGTKIGLLQGLPAPAGTAICKDLDYPRWIRRYQNIHILFVPAWDFIVDGWQHSRMAILRGVENGFTVVRAARQGRLTISDYRGKVLREAISENGQEVSLLADAPDYGTNTLYSEWGDWFGMACLTLTLCWLANTWRKGRQ